MIQYIQSGGDALKLRVSKKLLPKSWVRIENPTETEISYLIKHFGFDETIITDALDPHEIPRLEIDNKTIYFVTRIPDTDDDFNDFTTPIMFALNPDHIFSISRDSLGRLWQPFIAKSELNTTNSTPALIAMCEAVAEEYQRKVTMINRQMRAASKDVTQLHPKDIAVFVEYERKLNDYLDALMPTNDALRSLLNGKIVKMSEEERDTAEDIAISFQQVTARCMSLLRTITNLRDSYRAVMDTRLNETIRLLTVITLALTIPTMLAGLFGMNVELPGHEQSPATFWVIAAIALGTSAVMMFYFLYKRR